uniref:Uncharacterized protein n=1 Tax=Anguilla anguilla TaxID=7936 RepID=A0A0E9S0Q4_ANGAN
MISVISGSSSSLSPKVTTFT